MPPGGNKGVSELYSTIEENKDIIRGIPNVLTQGTIESLLQDLEPIIDRLKKFQKGSVLPVNTNDSVELILKFINMNPEMLESIKNVYMLEVRYSVPVSRYW